MCRRMILLACVFVLSGCTRSASDGLINVGHVGALSGPDRFADEQAARGLRLALMDKDVALINDKPIQVRHTDTRGHLDAYEAQAVRLVSLSKASSLYGGNSAEEVMRLDRGRATVLSPLGYRPGGVSDQIFFLGLSPRLQGATLATFAVDRMSMAALLFLAPDPFGVLGETRFPISALILKEEQSEEADQLSQAFVETWSDAWSKRGEKAVSAPTIRAFGKDADWKETAGKIDELQPTCLVFAGKVANFRSLLTHVSSRPLLLYAGRDGSLKDASADRLVYHATAFAAEAEQPMVQEFAKKHRESFKAEPDVHAALAYDGARMISIALKKSQASGNSLAYELRGLKDFPGATGPISFGTGQVALRPVYVVASEGSTTRIQWGSAK